MTATPKTLDDRWSVLANDLFAQIRSISTLGIGVTRPSYGENETQAMKVIEGVALEHGLHCQWDDASNLWISLTQANAGPAVVIGSHMDSVPEGGNYDGLAGVLAGLLVLLQFKAEGVWPAHPVKVLALRGEESAWFGKAYVGSLALTGQLSCADLQLKHRETGQTLQEAMQNLNIPIQKVQGGQPLVDLQSISAYLELHIEQGPAMVARHWPVSPVTGIRGNIRHNRIRCLGETGHSGAVPRWLRKDAVLAVAELLSRLDEHWRVLQQMGLDLVMTCGILSTNARSHAVSVIPGEVEFSFEVRSQNAETLEQFYQLMRNECEQIAQGRGVRFEFDRKLFTRPAVMDPVWINKLLQACIAQGIDTETMPSGAGHDAAVFANLGIPSGMLFIRNDRGSHNPNEAMEIEDFMLGVNVLKSALL
ncbi:hydantoinase/carbamoylase family amidase [Orrella daihaiensis]|uniref:Hydantoinase/carbamoylase family amidase n=1 Tax=Orrella daihaiensis TaxID=2782176 RepID=A0ABY4AGY2_9BURK|nr:hydantoinase/carbamoylase family amidase [Orrella daihaiensis]UOD49527.1 hydantoinase/carbamoylase family amidase [Orrella daihaiensis]